VTALVFGKLLFPKSDPLVGVLEAFAVFFIGFLGRPIGAAIFGHWGDRIGRKATLIATLLVTGFATAAVGLVPTYESIGIWGAVLLTIIRLIQGIGVGGEWGGSVLLPMEWARTDRHRGFIASWPQFGAPAGFFLANLAVLVFSWLSGDQFLVWGWRIPDQHRHGRGRAVDPARHSRNPGLPKGARRGARGARAGASGAQASAQRGGIAGGPSPFIATALLAAYHSSLPIVLYILGCSVVGIIATALLTDYTNKDISAEYERV
jgi:Sugar (and other) transporter